MAEELSVLPVIDLANFPAELEKLGAASTELGCFRVTNHGLPASLPAMMKETARSLFNIPDEVKLRNVIHNLEDSGYMPPNFAPDIAFFESFCIHDAASPTNIHSFCSDLEVSSQQRQIITDYFEKLHGVIMDVVSKVAESLGLVGYSFKDWSCAARLNHYNFKFQEDIGSSAIPIHTDSGFMTILQVDECVGGLEMMDANGNFISIDSLPGTLLVIIGDSGKAWSNGRLQTMKHRVICKEAMPRFSIVLFLLAPKDGYIDTEPAFIDDDHPKLYQKFSYNKYLERRRNPGTKMGEVLPVLKEDNHTISTNTAYNQHMTNPSPNQN